MGKKITIVAVVIGIAVAAFIAVQPMLTVKAIETGLEQQDQAALEQHIDFPQVREGLKGQLSDLLEAQLKAQAANNPFAMLGASFVGKLADGIVEKMVTPKGLMNLLSAKAEHNKREKGQTESPNQPEPTNQPESGQQEAASLTKADYRVVNLSLIELIMPAKEGLQPIKAHLTRSGIKWRLTKIIAPTDTLMPK